MKKATIEPNETWLHGKYIVSNHKVEINTSLPYFAIDGYRIDFFQQGEEAQNTINELHAHWLRNNCTIEESIQWFINTYL
jgi:hypothetical protein